MRSLIACSILLSSASFAAGPERVQCLQKQPTVACIELLATKANLHRIDAALACKGGVSIDCIEHIYAKTKLTRHEAAQVCKGGVTVECVEHLATTTGLERVEAAHICSANEN